MIIIQLAGGLGNQMFQYALYLQLKSLGKDVKIDDVSGFAYDAKRDPALSPFGISYERATAKELESMLDSSMLLHNRIRRKICGRKKKSYFEADKRFMPEIMTWDDIYLEGYWQTEKYFHAVADEVRESYDLDKLLQYIAEKKQAGIRDSLQGETEGMGMEEWLAHITSTESVSVHIRRGDYLLPENQALFGGICTQEYYRRAMEQMRQEHPDCTFYIFTNDKQWAKEWIADKQGVCKDYKDTMVVQVKDIGTGEHSDYEEFVLMGKCRHNILANSSFSWWASYLNSNPHKTVLAPDKWLNGWDCEDCYREDMQRVEVLHRESGQQ